MRQDYAEFTRRGAEILALGPDGPKAFKRFWEAQGMPFPGLADVGSKVAGQFGQEVNWLKLGRMPAIFIIDREGLIRYSHYGQSMQDIPENAEVLAALDRINPPA